MKESEGEGRDVSNLYKIIVVIALKENTNFLAPAGSRRIGKSLCARLLAYECQYVGTCSRPVAHVLNKRANKYPTYFIGYIDKVIGTHVCYSDSTY